MLNLEFKMKMFMINRYLFRWNYAEIAPDSNPLGIELYVKFDGVYRNVKLNTPGEELFDKNGERLDSHIRKLF